MRSEPACRFTISRPPSTNNLHGSHIDKRTGKMRRHNTAAYKAWIKMAGWEMRGEHVGPLPRFEGEIAMLIACVKGIDIDNIKAIPDLLKTMGVIADDKLIADLRVTRAGLVGERVTIAIWPMGAAE